MNTRPASSGFTLIETIVAMAIAGITFAALFGGMATATRGVARIDQFEQELETARSLLAAIDALGDVGPGETAGGTFGGHDWRVETANFIPATERTAMAVIRLRLSLETGDGTVDWEIDSFKLVNAGITNQNPSLQAQLDEILN